MASNKAVLILSDAYLFVQGMRFFLENHGGFTQVLTESTFEGFEQALQHQQPEVIFLDLSAKEFKVEKVIAYIDFTAQSKIVLLGEQLNVNDCKQLKQWGASGVLLKSSSESEMLTCLSEVRKGSFFMPESSFLEEEDKTKAVLEKLKISEREQEIIRLIAEGFINKEIADQLFLSTHTVNTHRKNIMQKLGINNTAGIVLFAVKEGIISPNEFLFN